MARRKSLKHIEERIDLLTVEKDEEAERKQTELTRVRGIWAKAWPPPTDPSAPEWRGADEIEAGVPRWLEIERRAEAWRQVSG